MRILDNAFMCCVYELDSLGFRAPSETVLRGILEVDEEFSETINRYYSNVKEPHGLDSQDRDDLMDIIGRNLLGQAWPRYGDGEIAYDDFITKLRITMRDLNWEVT